MNTPGTAVKLSFFVSLLILGVKALAYYQTGSMAILSDALESIINVAAAGLTLVLMRYILAPADDNHPYGHGKLEYFSASFEGGLIGLAGLLIAREAIDAWRTGVSLHNLDSGLGLALGAALANLCLGLYVKKVGQTHRSDALLASGAHILSDVWTTAGAAIGLLLVWWTGLSWIDPLVALIIAANLSYTGFKIFRRATAALLDETDPETLDTLAQVFESHRRPGVVDIHLTKVIRSGNAHHVDCHLVVPEFWTVKEYHDFMQDFETEVARDYPGPSEFNFHIDPCLQEYCSSCSLASCPIRLLPFAGQQPITVSSLTSYAASRKDQPR